MDNIRGDADVLQYHRPVHAVQTLRMTDRTSPRRSGRTSFRRSCRAADRALPMVLKPGRRQTEIKIVHSLACLSLLGMTSPDPGCAHPTITAYHCQASPAQISWQHHRGLLHKPKACISVDADVERFGDGMLAASEDTPLGGTQQESCQILLTFHWPHLRQHCSRQMHSNLPQAYCTAASRMTSTLRLGRVWRTSCSCWRKAGRCPRTPGRRGGPRRAPGPSWRAWAGCRLATTPSS